MRDRNRAGKYFILFMAISFLGWAAETAFFYICYGTFHDRGFMTLPFCTIYGFSFLLLHFLLEQKAVKRSRLVGLALCVLVPTGLELLTGWLFRWGFGLRLWSYESYRFHYQGYICLEYALLWGILLPPSMRYLFYPLKRWIFSLTDRVAAALSSVLAVMAAVDWTINFSRQTFLP